MKRWCTTTCHAWPGEGAPDPQPPFDNDPLRPTPPGCYWHLISTCVALTAGDFGIPVFYWTWELRRAEPSQ